MAKNKREKKKVEEDNKTDELSITWSEPELNKATGLFEVKKIDQNNSILDIITDSDKESLLNTREKLIKQHIISLINKNKQENNNNTEEKKSRSGKIIRNKVSLQDSKEEILNEIIKRKLDGEDITTIVREIAERVKLKPLSIGIYVDEAMNIIRSKVLADIDTVLETHIRRYEELYSWFKIRGKIRYAAKALGAKERLLGVGSDSLLSLEINNILQVNTIEEDNFNIKQLDKKKQDKMIQLIKKAKRGL